MIHSMGSFNHFMLYICICAYMCDSLSIFAYRSFIRQISLNIKKREKKKGKRENNKFRFFFYIVVVPFPLFLSFFENNGKKMKFSKSLKDNIGLDR